MTIDKILAIADESYANATGSEFGLVAKGVIGDTLATFLALELRDTYEEGKPDKEQLQTALMAIRRAAQELAAVADVFEDAC